MKDWELIIYIPTYNAASCLPELFEKFKKIEKNLLRAKIKALIIVNDGSSDETADVIVNHMKTMSHLKVLNKEKNEGPAAAIFDGMEETSKIITDPEKTICIRMDSDLEHNPKDIELLIKPIIEETSKVSVGYVPFDYRSSFIVVWFNKKIGLIENKKFINKEIPQFCPGFNAVRGDLFLQLLPILKKKRAEFLKINGKDMLTIDFIILAVAHKLGNDITYTRLSPIEDKWIKKIPLNKILSYLDYHRRTMRFLNKSH